MKYAEELKKLKNDTYLISTMKIKIKLDLSF